MTLTDLFAGMQGVLEIKGEAEIEGLEIDSRKVKPKDVYFCQPGARFDGHDFAQAAAAAGASALVVSRPVDVDLPQVLVRDVREAVSLAASRYYGNPA